MGVLLKEAFLAKDKEEPPSSTEGTTLQVTIKTDANPLHTPLRT